MSPPQRRSRTGLFHLRVRSVDLGPELRMTLPINLCNVATGKWFTQPVAPSRPRHSLCTAKLTVAATDRRRLNIVRL